MEINEIVVVKTGFSDTLLGKIVKIDETQDEITVAVSETQQIVIHRDDISKIKNIKNFKVGLA